MSRRTGRIAQYTAKFAVGEEVDILTKGGWESNYGTVVKVDPLKSSHHYQLYVPGEIFQMWFSENELSKREDMELA